MNRPPSQAVIEAVEWAMREHQNLVGPMRHIFGDEVGDAVEVLLAQEVQAAAPEVARAAERDTLAVKLARVEALLTDTEWLHDGTEGRDGAGIARWPSHQQDAYSLAIEEAALVMVDRIRAALDDPDGGDRG